MKKIWSFFVGLFAVIGVLIVAGFVFLIVSVAQHRKQSVSLPDSMVLSLVLDERVTEHAAQSELSQIFEEEIDFHKLVSSIRAAGKDRHVKALFVDLREPSLGLAQIQELRDAVADFQTSKKPAILATDSFGELSNGTGFYYLASQFDRIAVQPAGFVGIAGIALEQPFLRGFLDEHGIGVDVEKRKEYKTAFDFMTEKNLTPANREETETLLKNLSEQIISAIAERRHLSRDIVWDAMNKAPLTVDEALPLKLIDQIAWPDQARKQILDEQKAEDTDIADYIDNAAPSLRNATSIAVIYGSGAIVRHDAGGIGMSDKLFAADGFTDIVNEILEEKKIKAVIVRVDSPGGSATASETVRRGILRLKESGRPVIVAMGNYAASGGYWMSVDADKIIAEPATLTGSIGVLGGKIALRELLERNNIHVETTTLNDNAGMWSLVDHFTPSQRARFAYAMDYTYDQFVDRVAKGRHLTPEKVEKIARGRVWTGAEAQKIGLVDELGGMATAYAATRTLLKLPEDAAFDLHIYPEEESPFDAALGFLKHPRIGVSVLWQNLFAPLQQRMQILSAPVLRIQ